MCRSLKSTLVINAAIGYTFPVTELIPPVEPPEEDETEELSLAERLLLLQQEHRALDKEIADLYAHPYQDQLYLQRMKKRKLCIKDGIERLKDDIIPDLNA